MPITERATSTLASRTVSAAPAQQARLHLIDNTKGIAIILVVFGHLWSGLIDAQIAPDTAWSQFIFDWIYSFHMPVFFFVAGVFAVSSANKRGTKQFIIAKSKTILHPFIVWSILQITVETLLADHLNNPPVFSLEFLLQSFILYPYRNMWFLFHYFIVLMVFILIYNSRFKLWGLTLFTIMFFLLGTISDQFVLYLSARFMPFFLLGIFFATPVKSRLPNMATKPILAFTISAFALVTMLALVGIDHTHQAYILTAFIGILGTLALGHLLTKSRIRWVELCGVYSLEIYLTHIFTSSGIRIIIQQGLGLDLHWSIHAGLGLIAGIGCALLLVKLFERINFDYAFRVP